MQSQWSQPGYEERGWFYAYFEYHPGSQLTVGATPERQLGGVFCTRCLDHDVEQEADRLRTPRHEPDKTAIRCYCKCIRDASKEISVTMLLCTAVSLSGSAAQRRLHDREDDCLRHLLCCPWQDTGVSDMAMACLVERKSTREPTRTKKRGRTVPGDSDSNTFALGHERIFPVDPERDTDLVYLAEPYGPPAKLHVLSTSSMTMPNYPGSLIGPILTFSPQVPSNKIVDILHKLVLHKLLRHPTL